MDYRERWELKDYLIGQTLERRIGLFQVAVVILLLGFLLNFWYLQGVRGDEYAHMAENNRLRRLPAMPTRGVIFDRNKTVLAATRPSLDLVLLRQGASDVEGQLQALVPILDTSYEALVERMQSMRNQPGYHPLVLWEDVSLAQIARIEARRERFPSLTVRPSERRSYAHRELFSHVIGYVGEVNEDELTERSAALQVGDIVGKTGVERGYDDALRGDRGWNLVSVNNLGRPVGETWVGQQPSHGRALQLTLDHRLQQALREGLADEVGAGVFMDPRSGEVLALVSTPSFDPTLFADGMTADAWRSIAEDPRDPLLDRATASHYAPGSVFKIVMAVAGLEKGAIDVEHTVQCNGKIKVYGRDRLCWKKEGHGRVNLRKALAHSCNVYFYLLGKQLGIEPIHEYGSLFNLGRPTGIDLPGESRGILPSRRWKKLSLGEIWYPGDTISVAIGQGFLAVTPVQMATMISGVAANGRVPRPHLYRGSEPEIRRLDIAPETLRVVREALRDAVARGTGREADVEAAGVAGKTGTAQVYRHSAGVDSDDLPKHERDHAWFVGYAPADRPTIAFAVVVEHGGHGGSAAAPIARRVLEMFFSDDPGPDPLQRTALGGRSVRPRPAG